MSKVGRRVGADAGGAAIAQDSDGSDRDDENELHDLVKQEYAFGKYWIGKLVYFIDSWSNRKMLVFYGDMMDW